MSSSKSNKLSNICMVLGVLLIVLALGYGVYAVVSSKSAAADNQKIVALAEKLMPPVVDAYPEERGNSIMPSIELEGVNVLGIIEMPAYSVKLPVGSVWNAKRMQSMPCRYDGSVYDRTLMIGTTDANGQFDFAADVSVEDALFFTDMEGGRYSYKVSSIKHATSFGGASWSDKGADLTVFVKDSLSGEYTVIYCIAK